MARRVALKILPFANVLDPRRMQRFQNEARAAASLHHPHIVPVYFVGCERGVHFYAMQLIQGQSLDKVVHGLRAARKGRLAGNLAGQRTGESPGGGEAAAEATTEELIGFLADPDSSGRWPARSAAQQRTVPLAKGSTERSGLKTKWERSVVQLISTVADALEHAHQHGVIHRDIKPANLMMDGNGKVWVTDFGLAQLEAGDTLTVSGDLLGTLRYMSPEQAAGRPCDPRSDVYSLGVTLYELLTLEPAFAGPDRKKLLSDILSQEPRPLRQLDPTLPVELEIVVAKAMAKEVSERYSSALELAADLRRFLNHEPILARRANVWQRGMKWCQRHIAVVAVLFATAAILGLAAAATSLVLWNQSAKLSAALQAAEQSSRAAESMRSQAELARAEEVQARQRATKKAAEAKAILDFLEENILAASRPEGIEGGQGREISLRAAIDQALPFIEPKFRDQPEIEIDLRRVLGVSYQHLGEFETAREQFRLAYELAAKHLGPMHLTALGSLVNLGMAARDCGDYGAAEQSLEEAWEHLHRHFPQHVFAENCLTNRAALDWVQGRAAAAAAKYETVLAKQLDRLGIDHRQTLDTRMNLALVYEDLGRYNEAETILQQVVTAQVEQFGADDSALWRAWNALATVEAKLHKMDSAIKIRRRLLDQQAAILGDDHVTTLGTRVNLALNLEDQGEVAEAERLLEFAVPRLKDKYPQHEFTLNGMNARAGVLKAKGALAEAVQQYEETLALSNELRGADHVFTLGVRVNLATCLLQTGHSQKAIVAYRQVLRKLKTNFPDHEFTRVALLSLSQAHMELGQYPAAMVVLKELVAKHQSIFSDQHPKLLESRVRLAHCYRMVGDPAASQTLLDAVLPILRRHYRGHELLSMAASDLASIQLDRRQVDLAVELFSEAYQARVEELGPKHVSTLGVLVNWGTAEWARGNLTVAAERMTTALHGLRESHPWHPFHGICLKHLVSVHEELERFAEEGELLEEFEHWLVQQGGTHDPQTYRVRVRQAQRSGNWEQALGLVKSFESQLEDEPSDFGVAAGLRARLEEMAVELHPSDPALATAQRRRVQAWLQQVENLGGRVSEECQFDPAMRRYFLRHPQDSLDGLRSDEDR